MGTVELGICGLRVATGVFFATTGYRKLFIPATHKKFLNFLRSFGMPRPVALLVMAGEWLGGLGLLFGCLTRWAAIGLLLIMLGAFSLDTFSSVRKRIVADNDNCISAWCSHLLCTPEAQLIIILFSLIFMGSGGFSIDSML